MESIVLMIHDVVSKRAQGHVAMLTMGITAQVDTGPCGFSKQTHPHLLCEESDFPRDTQHVTPCFYLNLMKLFLFKLGQRSHVSGWYQLVNPLSPKAKT